MNLTTLKYFVSVARLGSITQAAQAAYISESAVSKTIKQLENELGVKLFDRQGRTIKLNEQGQIFYSYVFDSLRLLNQGISNVQNHQKAKEENIKVLFTVGSPLISTIALKMQKLMPNVSLNIYQRTTFAKDLERFDFVVSSNRIKDFINIPLLNEEILVGWKNDFLNTPKLVEMKDLENYDFISQTEETELQQSIDLFLKDNNVHLNFKYQSDEPATVRNLVRAGLGISFIPSVTWYNFAHSKEITTAKIIPNAPHRTIFLNSPHQHLTNNQRIFSNEIANILTNIQS
ncbi:LysR family transcriptional regulator [uncultured Lactobacillus sp.]|uniref:LysR family transcriptional regulator n=1 Tax=uncultured Lactobacillus sp. TaxID=153152 RepID=UPI002804591F|nr:LysR family transcriptional regulator [uncultured Lactobacillus sp.]